METIKKKVAVLRCNLNEAEERAKAAEEELEKANVRNQEVRTFVWFTILTSYKMLTVFLKKTQLMINTKGRSNLYCQV